MRFSVAVSYSWFWRPWGARGLRFSVGNGPNGTELSIKRGKGYDDKRGPRSADTKGTGLSAESAKG